MFGSSQPGARLSEGLLDRSVCSPLALGHPVNRAPLLVCDRKHAGPNTAGQVELEEESSYESVVSEGTLG